MFKKLYLFLSVSIFFQFVVYAADLSEQEGKDYQIGIAYRDGKNFTGSLAQAQQKAVELFSPLASKGHVKSQHNLGFIFNTWGDAYYKNKNYRVAGDFYKKANYWFKKAADKGFGPSVTSLKTLEEKLNGRNYLIALSPENIALVLTVLDKKSLLNFLQTCGKGLECVDKEFQARSGIKIPLRSFNNDLCPSTKSYFIRELFEGLKDLPIDAHTSGTPKYSTQYYRTFGKNTIRYKKASELWKTLGYQGLGQIVFLRLGNANFSQFSNDDRFDLFNFIDQTNEIRMFVYEQVRKLIEEKLSTIDNIDESESLFAILTKYKFFPREIPGQSETDWEKEQRAELTVLTNHAKKLIQAGHPEVVKYYMDTALREIGYDQSSPNYFKIIQDELTPVFKLVLEVKSAIDGEDK